jgi:hypothetical protein
MTSTISVVRCGHSGDRLFTDGSTRSKNRNAYLWSRYCGPFPHQLPIDDGAYHSTFCVDVRYNVKSHPLMLAYRRRNATRGRKTNRILRALQCWRGRESVR